MKQIIPFSQRSKADIYREYLNDWLTVERMADNYNRPEDEMRAIIDAGKIEHEAGCAPATAAPEPEKLKAKVYAAYEKDGGYSRALDIANNSGLCDYEYCKGCDNDTPVIKGQHECLICGQETAPEPSAPEPSAPIRREEEGFDKGEYLRYFDQKKMTFTGINGGNYLDEEDFETYGRWSESQRFALYRDNVRLQEELESWKKKHFETVEMASETIKGLQEENKELKETLKKAHDTLHEISAIYQRDKEGFLKDNAKGWDAELDIEIEALLNRDK